MDYIRAYRDINKGEYIYICVISDIYKGIYKYIMDFELSMLFSDYSKRFSRLHNDSCIVSL